PLPPSAGSHSRGRGDRLLPTVRCTADGASARSRTRAGVSESVVRERVGASEARGASAASNNQSKATNATPRSANSTIRRRERSAGEGIHHDVDAELGGVLREKALAVGVERPLRAVILAAVQHVDATVAHDALEILVHEVVAPPIELVARGGWALGEREEAEIERMVVRNGAPRSAEPRQLTSHGAMVFAVHVVVVIVHKHESPPLHES